MSWERHICRLNVEKVIVYSFHYLVFESRIGESTASVVTRISGRLWGNLYLIPGRNRGFSLLHRFQNRIVSRRYSGLIPGIKWPVPEADHSPPSSAESKNTISSCYVCSTWQLFKHRNNFTFLPLQLRKAPISFVMSVRKGQRCSHTMDFRDIWYWDFYGKLSRI